MRRVVQSVLELMPLGVFGLATLAAAAAMAAYWLDLGTQWFGGFLALSFLAGGIGFSLVSRINITGKEAEGEREPPSSPPQEWAQYDSDLQEGAERVGRRKFLVLSIFGFFGTVGLAAVSALRSMGPNPAPSLFNTSWVAGRRLVRDDGTPVAADALEDGAFLTVFPEGHRDKTDSQVLLLKIPEGTLELPADRMAWTVKGLVAYSKICTHAGCPVGQYEQSVHLLACPCHQSTFDVLRGAVPTGGPAARPLPQLPLGVNSDGYLVARGGFPTAVGPGFWSTNQ